MKKIVLFMLLAGAAFSMSHLFGSGMRGSTELADIYVCSSGPYLAELQAKANVSRMDLYVASYCTCQAIDPQLREDVEVRRISANIDEDGNITSVNEEDECLPPRDQLYSCVCVGRSSY